jgi:hypothetical protein
VDCGGNRPSLQDEDPITVTAPLDVHRRVEKILDREGKID